MLVILLAIPTVIYAQDSSPVTADDVNEVARELWCPLCSGVRLDGCELKACDQMKDEIAIMLESGEDTATIKNYFVNQYGPQVLGEPPREGFNLMAWVLPFAVLLGGGVFLLTRGRKLFQSAQAETPPAVPSAPAAGGAANSAEGNQDGDPYNRLLDEELARYD